jgi:hypothetical protein
MLATTQTKSSALFGALIRLLLPKMAECLIYERRGLFKLSRVCILGEYPKIQDGYSGCNAFWLLWVVGRQKFLRTTGGRLKRVFHLF